MPVAEQVMAVTIIAAVLLSIPSAAALVAGLVGYLTSKRSTGPGQRDR